MALGTVTVVKRSASQGPIFYDSVTVQGDDAYAAGGSDDFEAKIQEALGSNREVIAVLPGSNALNLPQWDEANKALVIRLISTGAERANGNDSGNVHAMVVVSK